MVVVPAVRPVVAPKVARIEETAGLLLLHVPGPGLLVNATPVPVQ